MEIRETAARAKQAAIQLAAVSTDTKNRALAEIASALASNSAAIAAANQQDLKRAEQDQLAAPLLKRLRFDEDKIKEACVGLQSVIGLTDPVGQTLGAMELDQGLELYRVSRPIGVIGVIFESRPDAMVQISALCLKSGNGVLLKGGSEAAQTNRILADIIGAASVKAGIPDGWIGLLENRSEVADMLGLDESIDLIIPRGSNEFVKYIMDHTHIPVLGHADGICHVYIDKVVDEDMAINIAVDSKTQYVAVCNAAETILVHQAVAPSILPRLKEALNVKGVEIRACEVSLQIIDVSAADEQDWRREYLDLMVSIKVVPDMGTALDHINQFGSGHTDVIVSDDKSRAVRFMDLADTADAFWNCSSRFADGFRYGLGAEVGISTNKIHARGPVGLEGLLIYQWRLLGAGHVVADYTGPSAKPFAHKKLDKSFGQ